MSNAVADPENVTLPPTVSINKMSDKFKEAMAKGSTKPTEPKATAPTPAPEPAKAPEPPKPVAPQTTMLPDPVAPELPKEPEPKVEQKETKKIPSEQFKILEKQRDEFRSKAEAVEAKVKELEAKLTETTSKLIPDAELEALKNERELYKQIAERVGLEHTPEFKRAFTEKIDQLRVEVKDAIGGEHADKVARLLKMPPDSARDEQIEQIADELSGFKQANLIRAYSELRRTERDRDAELAKAGENVAKVEEFRAQQERQHHLSRAKATEDALTVEMSKFAALPAFKAIDGNAEHNAIVDSNTKMVKALVSADLPPADRARLAIYAVKGMDSIRTDALKDALISKLQTQIAELQGANPTVRGKGTTKTETGAPANNKDKPLTFAETVKRVMAEGIPDKE